MKTPDFILIEDYEIWRGQNKIVLPVGSFIRPIDHRYLPKHIQIPPSFDAKIACFCYTKNGIFCIEKEKFRQV